MASTMTDTLRHQLRATINQKLIESGEKESLKDLLRTKLVQCGWKDDMKAHCREVITAKGVENVNVEDLVAEITPKGRAEVPAAVKAELLQRIRATLTSIVCQYLEGSMEENSHQSGDINDDYDVLSPENMAKLEAFLNRNNPPEDSDSSEDTDDVNTIGRSIPLEWYNNYSHIGYDIEGKQILKSKGKDELDKLLDTDDPNHWRTIRDTYNNRDIVISTKDLALIRRLRQQQFPPNFDPYPETIEIDNPEDKIHPLTNRPEPKRRFIPSKWEAQRVAKIVKAIRNGWIDLDAEKRKRPEEEDKSYYLIWDAPDDEPVKRITRPLPAPSVKLPTHRESYRPPIEYLLDEEEQLAWEDAHPADRPFNFLPQCYDSLRQLPFYENSFQERFERCLDLFLVPRKPVKRRRLESVQSLLPQLPKREDLRPFPITNILTFEGHEGEVLCLSVDPEGHYIASGSGDCTVRVWEISTGRCCNVYTTAAPVVSLAWNPNPSIRVIAAATGKHVVFFDPCIGGSPGIREATLHALDTSTLKKGGEEEKGTTRNTRPRAASWLHFDAAERANIHFPDDRITLALKLNKSVSEVKWHHRGDYLATVAGRGKRGVLIHQLSTKRTQAPFRKNPGDVQAVLFHPKKPFFFLANRTQIHVYDLVKQAKVKKLTSTSQWISSMDIHKDGDNLIVGGHDQKFCWFDLDLSTKPYKNLRYHKEAVQGVTFHPTHPLFATCSDDGSVYVFHGMVYDDLLQNPLVVPLKRLHGHEIVDDNGVHAIQFHPTHPWILSAGADGTVRVWAN